MSDPRPVLPVPPAPIAALPVPEPYASVAASWPGREPLAGVDLRRLRGFVMRLSITGAILGALVFLILLYLIVYVLPDVAFGFGRVAAQAFDRLPSPFLTILPAAAALAMAGMVLFYCVRTFLTFRQLAGRRIDDLRSPAPAKSSSQRPPLPFLRSDLNKIRLVTTPLSIIFLIGLVEGLGSGRNAMTPAGTLVSLGLIAGVLGSCWQLITVRRARWEVARIEGASFAATAARGFTVLPALPASPALNPLPVIATASTTAPPPLAVAAPMALSADVAADLEAAEHAGTFTDWETLVQGIAILGILLGVLSMPAHLEAIQGVWRQVTSIISVPAPPGSPAPAAPISQSIELFGALQALAAAVAVGWVAWGLICLCGGPRFRPFVLSLTWAGLIVAAAVFLVSLQWDEGSNSSSVYRNGYRYSQPTLISLDSIYGTGGNSRDNNTPLLSLLLVTLFSLVVLLLVTRQAVKSVFAYRPRRARR